MIKKHKEEVIELLSKINEIDQFHIKVSLSICDQCTGIDNCKQTNQGIVSTIILDDLSHKYLPAKKRCHLSRGQYNDSKIKQDKYKIWEADNKQEIMNHIKKFNNLYLWGKVGKGKSHGLYYLSNYYNLQGKDIHIETLSSINNRIKNEFNRNLAYDEVSLIDKLQDIDYLFIDDFGNSGRSEYDIMSILFPLIDYRYVNNKPTFISSNYSLKDLYILYSTSLNNKNALPEHISSQQVVPIMSRLKTFGEIEIVSKNWRL